MKRQSLYVIELSARQEQEDSPLHLSQKFSDLFQTAILFSLLERRHLTKWQFDFCLDELKKQNKASHPLNRQSLHGYP